MTKKPEPLTKFLLPIDRKGTFTAACRLTGALTALLEDRVTEITLLHVMGGRYLSTHMTNIDIRAGLVLESETFKRLREEFINREIAPVMNRAKELVAQFRPKAPIDMEIVDGKPADKILEFVKKYNYSTVVMQRRCMDPVKGSFIGSVTSGILYGRGACSVYIPGTDFPEEGSVDFKNILIPIDGSVGSLAAVKEAGVFMGYVKDTRAILLTVMDVADIAEAAESESWPSPLEEAEGVLKTARKELEQAGIGPERIVEKALAGDPSEIIASHAEESNADIIFLGRTIRSAITDVLVGSVGRAVLGKCAKKTIALVSPEEESE